MPESRGSFANKFLETHPELRPGAVGQPLTLEQLQVKHMLSKVEISEEDANGQQVKVPYYIAEGDLLLDEDEVILYDAQQEALQQRRRALYELTAMGIAPLDTPAEEGGLVAVTDGEKIVRWRDGLLLSYCVLRSTFLNEAQYAIARDNMLAATNAWESTCGVQFEYRPEFDTSLSLRPPGVLFPVRGIDADGQFIAAAFFPDDPPFRRRVVIDPSYFTTTFDKVGVLRHELGHVLGFRHEHIRSGAPAVCPDEDSDFTLDLTQYDPRSVMHYFCGGAGSPELAISELDAIGAQKVYGPAFNRFSFFE